jgi:hypothetical protein
LNGLGYEKMSAKESYKEFTKTEEALPIFSKSWWLDAVCGNDLAWDAIMVTDEDNNMVTFPFCLTKNRLGPKSIIMPGLTQTLGPYFKIKENTKLSKIDGIKKELCYSVIDQLPNFKHFDMKFHRSFTNWQPFYWKGFQQTTRYSSRIQKGQKEEQVFNGINKRLKVYIKKNESNLKVEVGNDISEIWNINKDTFERKDTLIPYSLDFLKRMDSACKEHDCRRILISRNESGKIMAFVYLIWDSEDAYLLLGGRDPEYDKSNVKANLVWESIKMTLAMGRNFDFEGSMMEGVQNNNCLFGCIVEPYSSIRKTILTPYEGIMQDACKKLIPLPTNRLRK